MDPAVIVTYCWNHGYPCATSGRILARRPTLPQDPECRYCGRALPSSE